MSAGNPDVRVPKRRVRVELDLHGDAPRVVEMFVAEHQEVLALLVGDARFIPVLHAGTALLVGRDAVAWCLVESAEPEELMLFEHRREVRVTLDDGDEIVGTLVYSAPPESARLIDELNRGGPFFQLWSDRGVYLVRKSMVKTVIEIP